MRGVIDPDRVETRALRQVADRHDVPRRVFDPVEPPFEVCHLRHVPGGAVAVEAEAVGAPVAPARHPVSRARAERPRRQAGDQKAGVDHGTEPCRRRIQREQLVRLPVQGHHEDIAVVEARRAVARASLDRAEIEREPVPGVARSRGAEVAESDLGLQTVAARRRFDREDDAGDPGRRIDAWLPRRRGEPVTPRVRGAVGERRV